MGKKFRARFRRDTKWSAAAGNNKITPKNTAVKKVPIYVNIKFQ